MKPRGEAVIYCSFVINGTSNYSLDRTAGQRTLYAQDLALTQLLPAPGQLKR
jgi:hypothetical protein